MFTRDDISNRMIAKLIFEFNELGLFDKLDFVDANAGGTTFATNLKTTECGLAFNKRFECLIYGLNRISSNELQLHAYLFKEHRYVIIGLYEDDTEEYEEPQPEIEQFNHEEITIDDVLKYFNELLFTPTLHDELKDHIVKPIKYYPFGIEPLDEKIKGLYMGSLTMICGKSNAGKTYYTLYFMQNWIKLGLNVDYFNLEMQAKTMKDRLVYQKLKVPAGNKSQLFNSRRAILQQIVNKIKQRALVGIKVFIIDWLDKLIPLGTKVFDQSTHQATIVDTLVGLAYSLNVAIVMLNQMNKTSVVNGVVDWYGQVAGSSQVYNNCDTFIGLFDRTSLKPETREFQELKYVIEIHIDKIRMLNQEKGIVVVKSTADGIRALNFQEEVIYNDSFRKKTVMRNKDTALDKRFKDLEEETKKWASKLDPILTGTQENAPF